MKKISRRSFLKVAGIGAAALGLAACGGSSASTTTSTASSTAASAGGSDAGFTNTTLTLYSPGGENSVPTKTIIKYGELIEEATGGAVKCDVQYGGTLGNDAEAIESTRMGTIDLIFAGTSGFTSFYDKAKVMDLPFLFTSAEEANEVLNSTDIGEQIFADFGDYDLVYLAEGDNGMRHVSTVKSWGQIEKADDVIGLKIRVPQSQMYTDCWSTLGATPVALALTELTTALSNGTAQAQDNATYHEVANATWDDIGYFSFINYMWMGCTMAANKIAWDERRVRQRAHRRRDPVHQCQQQRQGDDQLSGILQRGAACREQRNDQQCGPELRSRAAGPDRCGRCRSCSAGSGCAGRRGGTRRSPNPSDGKSCPPRWA